MNNHGQHLRELLKSKGYDIQRLANRLEVSRVAIEKDLKRTDLTRRTLSKYVGLLFDSFEEFYESKVETVENQNQSQNQSVSLADHLELHKKYIELQNRYIELQNKHLALTERFFPNAVQVATISV